MTVWDPGAYARFWAERRRPVLDLLARLDLDPPPRRILDLGCGPGTVTTLLADRWPDAELTGVDASPEMLAEARALRPDLCWEEGDLATHLPAAAPDLVFSNAALHWVPDHEHLLPHLLGLVAPGGTLAWQVPDAWDEPSHTLAWELAAGATWRDRITPTIDPHPLLTPAHYLDLLLPLAAEVDLWTTTYHHVLDGDDPVVAWYLGSFLRAFVSGLEADEADAFVAEYTRRVARAYPRRPDGRTVMPFRRVFCVARALSVADPTQEDVVKASARSR